MKRMADVTHIRIWSSADEKSSTDGGRLKKIPAHTSVFEIDGPMFFADADKFSKFPIKEGDKVLIVRMRNVPALDGSAMRSLHSLYRVCQKKDIILLLSHVNEQPLSVMKKSGFFDEVGESHFLANIDAALDYASTLVPKED